VFFGLYENDNNYETLRGTALRAKRKVSARSTPTRRLTIDPFYWPR
jgi:hypothetical protein